ncbi:ABC transporter [Vairimorpha necatrix]|uniref:ABC transporter n=1 Tax=Vairimorpha necatrix TaxID=6039 RepID=A0AAX4JFR7_9MICR
MEREAKTLQFENLYYDVPNVDPNIHGPYAEILKSLSGKVESGKLTAVLGSSGCGKTHFLRMLVGDISGKSKTFGRILYNGEERDPEEWKMKFSYVPQDDIFYPDLSIYDHMKYYMSLGEAKYREFDERKADKILDGCAILHKKNSLVGSLSGGERKRALIAISMINDPEILILDEPTTGLDSNTALEIIYTLKKYAQDYNCMVISTIHQPGAGLFSYFDDLIVLVKLGVFYIGPYKQLESFLVENGISTESDLSLPELLFVIISDHSLLPEAKKYKSNVKKIIEKNKQSCRNENTPTICNNYKTLTFKPKLYDSWKVMKHSFDTTYNKNKSYFVTVLIAFISILFILLEPILHFFISLSYNYLELNEELKKCSYDQIFSLSFGIVNHLYSLSHVIWVFYSHTNVWKYNEYFAPEYLNGKYTYGTYFMAMLYYSLIRNFMFFFPKFCCFLLFYRNFLFHPLVFLVFTVSTIINIFLYTCMSIIIEYNRVFWYIYMVLMNISQFNSVENELYYDDPIAYLSSIFPIFNFRLFLRMRCFGLLEKFKNAPAISKFLSKTFVEKIIRYSYEEGAENTIIYNTFGKWADFITIFTMFGSCLLLIGVVTVLFKINRIPYMRFKLS